MPSATVSKVSHTNAHDIYDHNSQGADAGLDFPLAALGCGVIESAMIPSKV